VKSWLAGRRLSSRRPRREEVSSSPAGCS
jgi:hypothetical protein